MVIAYILVLVVSAWLITFGLVKVAARVMKVVGYSGALPSTTIALIVGLAFLIVVNAPGWLFVLVALSAAALHSKAATRLPSKDIAVLIALAPLVVAPLLGASSGYAVDAAVIAAAILGGAHAS